MSYNPTHDHYTALGVSADAPLDDIKRAYRARSRAHHPDRNPGDPRAEERAKWLNEAWRVLRDAERRRVYDNERADYLAGRRSTGKTASYDPWAPQARTASPNGYDPWARHPWARPDAVARFAQSLERVLRSERPLAFLAGIAGLSVAFGVKAVANALDGDADGADADAYDPDQPPRRRRRR